MTWSPRWSSKPRNCSPSADTTARASSRVTLNSSSGSFSNSTDRRMPQTAVALPLPTWTFATTLMTDFSSASTAPFTASSSISSGTWPRRTSLIRTLEVSALISVIPRSYNSGGTRHQILEDAVGVPSVLLVELCHPLGRLGLDAEADFALIDPDLCVVLDLSLVGQQSHDELVTLEVLTEAVRLVEGAVSFVPALHRHHWQRRHARPDGQAAERHGSLCLLDESFVQVLELAGHRPHPNTTTPPTTAASVKLDPLVQMRRSRSMTQLPPL